MKIFDGKLFRVTRKVSKSVCTKWFFLTFFIFFSSSLNSSNFLDATICVFVFLNYFLGGTSFPINNTVRFERGFCPKIVLCITYQTVHLVRENYCGIGFFFIFYSSSLNRV